MTNTVVSSGVTSSGLTINNGDTLTVNAGGAVHDIVGSGGVINLSGSSTSNVVLFSGAVENILAGGLASGASGSGTGVSGGTLNVSSGGTLQYSTDYSGGVTNISSGGVADHLSVSSGGILNVAGTVLSNTAVITGGVENVLSGGLISGASGSGTGISGGTVNVSAGGSAAFVTVSSGGTFNIAGTVLRNVAVSSGGVENVLSGGLITGAVSSGTGVSAGGVLNILAGGSAAFVGVSSGGTLNVAGTFLSMGAVYSGGIENVLSGGVVSGLANSGTGVSGGTFNVLAGGSASFVGMSSGGVANVSSGGSLQNTTDYDGGVTNVLFGGKLATAVVSSGGILNVAGTVQSNLFVSSGGTVNVASGGLVSGVLSSFDAIGGTLNVSAGGSATVIAVSSGGVFNVAGTFLSYGQVFSGGVENILSGGVVSGAAGSGTGVSGGTVNISAGGSGFFIGLSSGGIANVSSGGLLASNTVWASGTENILAGGSAYFVGVSGTLNVAGTVLSNTGVYAGGVENVLSGGLISGASGSGTGISGGIVNVLAGGSAAFVGVSSGGTFNVAGTVLSNVSVNSGGVENVLSGGVVNGAPSSGTGVSGGTLNISAGGSASFVGVSSGGIVNVSSGGSLASSTDYFSGTTNVLSGGVAHHLTVSSGGVLNVAGTTLSAVTVSNGGVENVLFGGLISGSSGNGTVVSSGGALSILSGGSGAFISVSSGGLMNVAGTMLSNTALFTGGIENVMSGGLISGASSAGTGVSGGTLNILNAGSAAYVGVSSGGIANVSSGGHLEHTTDYFSGTTNILAGGTANNLTVSSGGVLNVAGLVLSNTLVMGGGVENVLSGGQINGLTSSGTGVSAGGILNVLAGGAAAHVGVSSGGTFNIFGTVLSNTGVYDGGVENVMSGGLISGASSSGTGVSGGTLNIKGGGSAAFVGVSSGGIVNVSSGGSLQNTTDYLSGVTNVLAGGKINNATVSGGGILNLAGTSLSNVVVSSGGVENVLSGGLIGGSLSAGNTIFGGGTVNVSAGGSASVIAVSSGGTLNVAGTFLSFGAIFSGGVENILSGGVVSGASGSGTGVSGGTVNISAGGSGFFIGVSSGGIANVSSGGLLASNTVWASGTENILAGGAAYFVGVSGTLNVAGTVRSNTGVYVGGVENVLSGGLISGASGSGTGISGGTVNVLAGGSAAFVGVSSGGTFNVAGTVLSNTAVFAGGVENVLSGGLISGASGSGTGISGGTVNLSAGASAAFVGVSSGGTFNVAGTTLSNVAVFSGGYEHVLSGGVANGTVISGGTLELDVGASAGSKVVFAGSGGTLRIDDTNMPAFTISGFTGGNRIDLAGVTFTSGGSAHLLAGNVLQVTENNVTYNLQLDPAVNYAALGLQFNATFDGAAGTYVNVYTNHIPTLTPTSSNFTASHFQTIPASSLFTATDPDGDAITEYTLWAQGTGHWVVNGVDQPNNTNIVITAAQLAQTYYQSGAGIDTLYGKASDGVAYSAWSGPFTVTGADQVPVVTPTQQNVTLQHGVQSIAATSLFTASDADVGDTISKYSLWDTEGNGHWFVNGVQQATNAEIVITAAQLAQTVYVAGSLGTDHLYARGFDGATFGAWAGWTVTPGVNQLPVVTPTNSSTIATHNQTFAASSLFTATDPDLSDTITQYSLWDTQGYGHWVVNGVVQATNAEIVITAAQLAQTIYQSGAATDTLYVRAFDGTAYGAWSQFTVAGTDQVPVVTPTQQNVTLQHGVQSIAATSLFTASDADVGDTVTKYSLWDTEGNGHWFVNGVQQATNAEIVITAAQLAQTVYVAGPLGTDHLYARAYDGALWGAWAGWTVTPGVNQLPVVTPTNSSTTATHNQTFAASNLFTAADADLSDTITKYSLWDTQGNGHWVVNGLVQATNAEIVITAAQLAQTIYQSGSGTDTLYARAFDGMAYGAWSQFTVVGAIDQAPVVNVPNANVTLSHGTSTIAASSLFTATDPDVGDTITKYSLWDTEGNGHWFVNGVQQATNAEIVVTAAQFAQTVYVTGTPGTDHVYARAYDGTLWGTWAQATVTPGTNQTPVVTPTNANTSASHGQSFAASSLFTASDADLSDTITQYSLWDTQGNGHWVVNGVVQATNAEIVITAAQLAQTFYQSGSGTDNLYARAFDGTSYGAWSQFAVTAPPDAAPITTATQASRNAGHHQSFAASSLFTVSDGDVGDTVTKYSLWDTEGNGHWVVNGVVQATNAEIVITAAQLAQTTYVSGSGGTDHLYVRAYDGMLWGPWTSAFTVVGPASNQAPTVATTASSRTTLANQSFAPSLLFSASDADGDPITLYDLWDTGGNGHWVVNGVQQATGAEIFVTAAQLAQTVYQSGTGTDQLYVRVNDGTAWSTWSSAFSVTGSASANIAAGATLELASASSAAVVFQSTTGTLRLDNSANFTGTVAGMANNPGDRIDFGDMDFNTILTPSFVDNGSNTGGVLTVADGTHSVNITLIGNYSASTFVASSDGHGGTFVADPVMPNNNMLASGHA